MIAPSRVFTVGDLSFRLEVHTGHVRSLRYRGHEVVRGIYPAVRGTNWDTIPPTVAPARIESNPQRMRAELNARATSETLDIAWHARIEADAGGTLRYHWRGEARRDSTTNRTGMCVLHAAELASVPCVIEHVDGQRTKGHFPDAIAPHQPFRAIRTVTHSFAPGGEVSVCCEGEVFEMEDQRNWTDASFKTYCRPLDWPKPYRLIAGTVVEHTITVRMSGDPAPRFVANGAARLATTPRPMRWPRIGFGLRAPLPGSLRERARGLHPSHLRVEATPETLESVAQWATPEAAALDCTLELAVTAATPAPPPRALLPPRCVILLFDEHGNIAPDEVILAWRQAGFDAVGTGTQNHFAELNRARPASGGTSNVTVFGIDAQEHSFDDTSLLETLTQHDVVARQAATFVPGSSLVVSPIVLGPGCEAADPRLHQDFGALWTLGSLARLACAGCVERVTYFQLHGPDGILRDGERATPLENLLVPLASASRFEHLPLEYGEATLLDALLVHASGGGARSVLIAHYADVASSLVIPFGVGVVNLAPRSVNAFALPS